MTANEAQMAAGRRWAARYRRYPARTEQERLDDFETAEQRDENERYRGR